MATLHIISSATPAAHTTRETCMDMRPEQQTAARGRRGNRLNPIWATRFFQRAARGGPIRSRRTALAATLIAPPSAMIIDSPAATLERRRCLSRGYANSVVSSPKGPFSARRGAGEGLRCRRRGSKAVHCAGFRRHNFNAPRWHPSPRPLFVRTAGRVTLADPSLREKLFESARKLWNACVARANTLLTNATDERTDHDPLVTRFSRA